MGRWRGALIASLFAAAALCAPRTALLSQGTGRTAPPAPGFAALVGVVDDSIRGRPLVGATVIVLDANRQGVTGADGVFRIDSIPAGEHIIAVKHPFLDTLTLSIVNKATFTVGKLEQLFFASIGRELFRDRICPRSGVSNGEAMVVGNVSDAETEKPLANAVVSLVYTDPTSGIATQRVRTARSRPDGFYVICGLPATMNGTVQAQVGAITSSEIQVTPKAEVVTTASFILNPAAKADSGARGTSVLRGRVVDAAGRGVKDAQVAVEGGNAIATTAEDGSFTLAALPSGTTSAVIRKIGFAPAYRTVHLRSNTPQVINVALAAGVTNLGQVTVTAAPDAALRKVGFTERMRMGMRSNFLTPDQLEKRMATKFTDLIRMLTGFRVTLSGNQAWVEPSRVSPGQPMCVAIYVDRVAFEQMTPGDLDNAFPAGQIAAVEGYASPTDTPAEYRMSGKSCATIIAWTKYRLSK